MSKAKLRLPSPSAALAGWQRLALAGLCALFGVVLGGPARAQPEAPARPRADPPTFAGKTEALTTEQRATMTGKSWRKGCPLSLDELASVTVTHWDYEGEVKTGTLIVDRAVADEVLEVFRELFAAKFPVERMTPVDAYEASDDKSMRANNTSAFNCRWVTGKKGVFSKHSYGRAIDVNPRTNPYVKGKRVEPAEGRAFLDRTQDHPGLIRKGDVVVEAFTKRGWKWGGRWRSLKDYQHFEKPRTAKR